MTHTDYLLKELKTRQGGYVADLRVKLRISKALAIAATKFVAGRAARLVKQKEEEIKRSKQVAKNIAVSVRHFWKVIEVVVSQRSQARLKEELRVEKEARQINLVNEAGKFAQAISEGLKEWENGLDPLMIYTATTPIFRCPSWYTNSGKGQEKTLNLDGKTAACAPSTDTDKEQGGADSSMMDHMDDEEEQLENRQDWALQEKEDEALSAEMTDSSDYSSSVDSDEELALLQREAEMSIDELKETFGLAEESSDSPVPTQEISSCGLQPANKILPLNTPASPSSRQKELESSPTSSCPISSTFETSEQVDLPVRRSTRRQESSKKLRDASKEAVGQSSEISGVRPRETNGKTGQVALRTGERGTRRKQGPGAERNTTKEPNGRKTQNDSAGESDTAFETEDTTPAGRPVVESIPGRCPIPFLLRATLRAYQHEGLTWLLTLHDNVANGILADEMGLGKTVQTIALMAYLACYRGIWGPHLVIVPSSVVLNWETEFQRFLPGFKILTYYGGRKERERRRQGWTDTKAFNVCIVSYTLVVADAHIFRRKPWYYMVLDEAQNIKNYQSQKWQALLQFNAQRRILLTGTPLQNDLTELWSLMHFLMPSLFESHTYWKEMFSDPLTQAIEASSVEKERFLVSRLHSILRPFLLRRLKRDVEAQMPSKYEHVVRCTLTKRQRALYNEFIERPSTKDTMASSDYFGLLNILMQLRKICNHPDLLTPREVSTPVTFVKPPALTFPRCVHLGLQEPWSSSLNDWLSHLDTFHPLVSLATNELMDVAHPSCCTDRPTSQSLAGLGSSRESCGSLWPNNCIRHSERLDDSVQPTPLFSASLDHGSGQESSALPSSIVQKTLSSSPTARNDHTASCIGNDLLPKFRARPFRDVTDAGHGESLSRRCVTCDTTMSYLLCDTDNGNNSPAEALLDQRRFDNNGILFPKTANHDTRSLPHESRKRDAASLPNHLSDSNKATSLTVPFSKRHRPGVDNGYSCYPPSLYDAVAKALEFPQEPFQPHLAVCYHANFRGPNDYTALRTAPQLPKLTELHHPATALCPPLEQLSTHAADIRYPKRQWTQQAQLRLRKVTPVRGGAAPSIATHPDSTAAPPLSPVVSAVSHTTNQGHLALYRKLLMDSAAAIGADPKSIGAPDSDASLATQWVHCAAMTVATLRRAPSIDSILQYDIQARERRTSLQPHPPFSRPACALWPFNAESSAYGVTNQFRTSNREADADTSTAELPAQSPWLFSLAGERRCLWGKRFREWIFDKTWETASSLPYISLHRPGFLTTLRQKDDASTFFSVTSPIQELCKSPVELLERNRAFISRFICIHSPAVRAANHQIFFRGAGGPNYSTAYSNATCELTAYLARAASEFHLVELSQRCLFPPKMTLQYDCGKMILLAELLRRLRVEGHKCILFTQMSRMLDLLEGFLNLHGYAYVRLDGSTKIPQRQRVVEIFNTDPRIFIFMASTRAGGVGLNLIGADTVIFYDTDWNPAMDRQAMDRCHRIGQTRDVHVYRLITEFTIEENILRKQLLKRALDDVVVDQGQFTTQRISDLITQADVKDMFFARKNDDDLYTTRILHESSATATDVDMSSTKEDSKSLFQTAIAQIEEMDHRTDEGRQDASSELSSLLYPDVDTSEFNDYGPPADVANGNVSLALDVSSTAAVIASLGTGNSGGTSSWTVLRDDGSRGEPKLSGSDEQGLTVPFWVTTPSRRTQVVPGDSSSATPGATVVAPQEKASSFSQRAAINIDPKTVVYVSHVVRIAIAFLEENPSGAILTDTASLQQRLAMFKTLRRDSSKEDDRVITQQN